MKTPINIHFKKAIFFFVCSLFFSSHSMSATCEATQDIKPLLKMGVSIRETMQTDFGRYYKSSTCYLETWPQSTREVANLVQFAYAHNIPIRTQGASHSENGSSLPHSFELLVHTTKLNQLAFDHNGRVTAGAGLPIALVKFLVEKYSSFFLPVANEGGIAPTVGGYISAGGISISSIKYGGFWEHVYEITLVTGKGNILSVKRHDPLFLYLFGAMGQLGIITEVKLNLLPSIDKNYRYPMKQTAIIEYPTTNGNDWTKPTAAKTIHWLNLFVSPNQLEDAKRALTTLQKTYPHALTYKPIYQWQVTYVSGMPPLLYNKKETFVAMGIWGYQAALPDSMEQLNHLQQDFTLLVKQKNYRRYIQTELIGSPDFYQHYFSKDTFMEFKKIKSKLDPKFLFNKGSFFKD